MLNRQKGKVVMGRKREGKEKEYWLQNGEVLLSIISNKRKLCKEIRALHNSLVERERSGDPDVDHILSKLNDYKYKLEDSWGKWGKRISQKPKDAERVRFDVSQGSYDQYNELAFTSNYRLKGSDTVDVKRCIDELPKLLGDLGITNTRYIGDLGELLKPFEDALKHKEHEMARISDDSEEPFSALDISRYILLELKKLNIQKFTELSRFVELSKSKELREEIDIIHQHYQEEIKQLTNEILSKKRRNLAIMKENDELYDQVQELKIEIKELRNNQKPSTYSSHRPSKSAPNTE